MSQNEIAKQGWIYKRGEHIKTWRSRYFILKTNGHFLGFNNKPIDNGEIDVPNNVFYIKDCKVIKSDKPKANVFILRCSSAENATIERFFAPANSIERDEWIKSIENVSNKLNGHCSISNQNDKNNLKITLHDFEFLKILGKGTFGKVILCREKSSLKLFAMKILKKSLIIEKNEINHTKTENIVMRTLKNPFITELIYSFQTSDLLCLVMEYVNGGELFFHLAREKKFSENKSRFYCAEICYAIGYLHQNNVIYRDLKLENILIDKEGHIKLADFGLCKMNMSHQSRTDTFCGTLEYLAPEIVLKEIYKDGYTRAVDWWAVGVVLYEMLVGRLPFCTKSTDNKITDYKSLFEKIIREDIRVPGELSAESRSMLTQLLEKNPTKRLGSSSKDFDDIKTHEFFKTIDWTKLINKQIEVPYKPLIVGDADTSYFEKEFTCENIQLTPSGKTGASSSEAKNYFDSFSYYGSKNSLLFAENQDTHNPPNSSDMYDTSSLIDKCNHFNRLKNKTFDYSSSMRSLSSSSSSLNSNSKRVSILSSTLSIFLSSELINTHQPAQQSDIIDNLMEE